METCMEDFSGLVLKVIVEDELHEIRRELRHSYAYAVGEDRVRSRRSDGAKFLQTREIDILKLPESRQ